MKKNSVTHGAFRKTSSKETKTNYPNKINRLLKTNITRRTLSATGKIRLVSNSPIRLLIQAENGDFLMWFYDKCEEIWLTKMLPMMHVNAKKTAYCAGGKQNQTARNAIKTCEVGHFLFRV